MCPDGRSTWWSSAKDSPGEKPPTMTVIDRSECSFSAKGKATSRKAVAAAEAQQVRYHVGNIFSADLFYTPDPAMFETLAKYNVYGVEMEAAGIFPIAAEHGAEALAICTVSDDLRSGEALTTDERATTFDAMITVALETAIA